jgi:membrane fusion protein, multidrug efflux system
MKTAMLMLAVAAGAMGQSLATTTVVAKPVDRFVKLTAEILPYQASDLNARIQGYVASVAVDRGMAVKKGQELARIEAPELLAQVAEAQARVAALEGQRLEALARQRSAESTAQRLKAASETPGAVAANELVLAEEAVKAARAAVEGVELSRKALEAQVRALREMERFLVIEAPFDGWVTERRVHPGALVGPTAGPLVRVEQLGRLRVVVAVPEANVSSVRAGQVVEFTVTGAGTESYKGTVSRVSRVLDAKTRTMPVELDVANAGGRLAPGMYTEVKWPAKAGQTTLLVPATAVASTTERTFVIRVEDGKARYVTVRKGAAQGEMVEVSGALAAGDRIIQRATDEIREGTVIPAR